MIQQQEFKVNIEITFKDGNFRLWKSDSYTDYMYIKNNLFVVINGSQWVGIYNMDTIQEIIVR